MSLWKNVSRGWCELKQWRVQVNRADGGEVKDKVGGGRFHTKVLRFLGGVGLSSSFRLRSSIVLRLSGRDLVELVAVIGMVWVDGVKERELGVVALTFANLVLKLRWVGGSGDKGGRPVDNGC
mgnify:CR=1 FL=1